MWVANGMSDDVTVIELPSRKPLASFAAGRTPWGIAIDD